MNKIFVLCCSTISLEDRQEVRKILEARYPNSQVYLPKLNNAFYFTIEQASIVFVVGQDSNQINKTAGIKTLRETMQRLDRNNRLGFINTRSKITGKLSRINYEYRAVTERSYDPNVITTTSIPSSPKKEDLVKSKPESMSEEQVKKLMLDIERRYQKTYDDLVKELNRLKWDYKELKESFNGFKTHKRTESMKRPELQGQGLNQQINVQDQNISAYLHGRALADQTAQASMRNDQFAQALSEALESPRITPRVDRMKFKLDLKSQTSFIVTYKGTTITNDLKLLLF